MAELDSDRNELPTPHKLAKAREKGSVAKSQDVAHAVMIVAAVLALYMLPARLMPDLALLMRQALAVGEAGLSNSASAGALIAHLATAMLRAMAPLLLLIVVAAVAAHMGQTGPMFSPKALQIQWTKLNPAQGLKRFATLKFLFEAVKSLLKMGLLLAVGGMAVFALVPALLMMSDQEPRSYLARLIDFSQSVCSKLMWALVLVAVLDLVFSRWDFLRQMHMSRRELRDEIKQREGDPKIRQRQRQIRLQMLQRLRAIGQVPNADVLITNPTHLGVAVRFDRQHGGGPQVLAKGAGELALRMRALATRRGVPIVENRPLARALFREVEIDGLVPERWYPDVARILAWVYARQSTPVKEGVA